MRQHLVDGAQALDALGMAGRRQVLEGSRVGEEAGGHGRLVAWIARGANRLPG
jgi:hypothetical protein